MVLVEGFYQIYVLIAEITFVVGLRDDRGGKIEATITGVVD